VPASSPTAAEPQPLTDLHRIRAVGKRLAAAGWAVRIDLDWGMGNAAKFVRSMPMRLSAAGRLEFYLSRAISETRFEAGMLVLPIAIGVAEEAIVAVEALRAEGFEVLFTGGEGDPLIVLPTTLSPDKLPLPGAPAYQRRLPSVWFWGGRGALAPGDTVHLWPASASLSWLTLCGRVSVTGSVGPHGDLPGAMALCTDCEALALARGQEITIVDVEQTVQEGASTSPPEAISAEGAQIVPEAAVRAPEPPSGAEWGATTPAAAKKRTKGAKHGTQS